MAVDDLAADGEADTAAFVDIRAVQPLERLENAFPVTFVEADAVVGDGNLQHRQAEERAGALVRRDSGGDADFEGTIRVTIFHRVGQEILHELPDLRLVTYHDRKAF